MRTSAFFQKFPSKEFPQNSDPNRIFLVLFGFSQNLHLQVIEKDLYEIEFKYKIRHNKIIRA
ncbi:hypothetical protein LEP1GSC040_2765 [Leptospira santarosai str. 2000030832]|nr:hypothetical protein LEP1GSC040_2765 [Leptospira santarosai str. 2000030832]